jgi:hypothetical protein
MSKKQSPKTTRKTAAKNPDIFFWINSEDEVVAFDDAVDALMSLCKRFGRFCSAFDLSSKQL